MLTSTNFIQYFSRIYFLPFLGSSLFSTIFLKSSNLWRPLIMITLYHQTKTPICFWCRQGLNPRSLIQPPEILPVELTRTHKKTPFLIHYFPVKLACFRKRASRAFYSCERPWTWGALKKEIWILFRTPLFLGKWCGVTIYFLYKKIRKTK